MNIKVLIVQITILKYNKELRIQQSKLVNWKIVVMLVKENL